jgi:hypothetical protein
MLFCSFLVKFVSIIHKFVSIIHKFVSIIHKFVSIIHKFVSIIHEFSFKVFFFILLFQFGVTGNLQVGYTAHGMSNSAFLYIEGIMIDWIVKNYT